MYKILSYGIIFLITAGLIFYNSSSTQASMNQDLDVLMNIANKWMGEDQKVTIKYGNFYKAYVNKGHVLKIGEQLSTQFNLPAASISLDQNDRTFYETIWITQDHSMQVSLRLTGMEEHQTHHLMITLEATGQIEASDLELLKNSIENELNQLGLSDQGNVIIQGDLTSINADQLEQWQTGISDSLNLQEVETYQDQRSLSVSYYSAKIHQFIYSGSQKMNVQIALHRDTNTNQMRATIGSPLITMEY
jgi:hypothetical protein